MPERCAWQLVDCTGTYRCDLAPGHGGWHSEAIGELHETRWASEAPSAVAPEPSPDDALSVLRALVAGADDHRCWYIPDEIAGRIRALVAEHPTDEEQP